MRTTRTACLLVIAAVLAAAPRLFGQEAKPVSLAVPALNPAAKAALDPAPNPVAVAKAAMVFLGVPYVHGGDSRQGLDCSGLVFRVFRDIAGVELPRGVGSLFRSGTAVRTVLHIGDLLFFDTSESGKPEVPTHVGVYTGSDRFVHAASEGSRTGVIVSLLDNPYYRDRYLGARRVVPWRAPVLPVVLTDEKLDTVLDAPFASREPLTVQVWNRMTGGGPMDLAVTKDGRPVLSRTIVPGAGKPAEVSIVPETGSWVVKVSRIWKGRELGRISFTVEE
jgi:hypothetical protein